MVTQDELAKLGNAVGVKWSRRDLRQAFKDMHVLVPPPKPEGGEDGARTGVDILGQMATNQKDGVTFEGFSQWYSRFQATRRREMRRVLRDLFQRADTEDTGILSKQEFIDLVSRWQTDIFFVLSCH